MQDMMEINVAPGSIVVVRDEEWLVTGVEHSAGRVAAAVPGSVGAGPDTTASFYQGLDRSRCWIPPRPTVVADDSHRLPPLPALARSHSAQDSRPVRGLPLTVSTEMLADSLGYQRAAVPKALDPGKLRPRILLADAVGLGKTLEIGMILSSWCAAAVASGS